MGDAERVQRMRMEKEATGSSRSGGEREGKGKKGRLPEELHLDRKFAEYVSGFYSFKASIKSVKLVNLSEC